MDALDIEIKTSAVVVRSQMRERIENNDPEGFACGHAGLQAKLACSRPTLWVGSDQRITQVGLGASVQTTIDGVADTSCFRKQVLQVTGDQLQLDLMNAFA